MAPEKGTRIRRFYYASLSPSLNYFPKSPAFHKSWAPCLISLMNSIKTCWSFLCSVAWSPSLSFLPRVTNLVVWSQTGTERASVFCSSLMCSRSQTSESKPKVAQVRYAIPPPHLFFFAPTPLWNKKKLRLILVNCFLVCRLFLPKIRLNADNTHKILGKLSHGFTANLTAQWKRFQPCRAA